MNFNFFKNNHKKTFCFFILYIILINTSLANNSIKSKYELFEFNQSGLTNKYNNFLSQQPITTKERENPNIYYNYNIFAFSEEGKIINQRMLSFITGHFSEKTFLEENLFLLRNINNHISGQLHTIQQEKNKIRKRINIENFFLKLKKDYNEINFNEEIKNHTFYNKINLKSTSGYIYEDKKIVIEIDNLLNENTNISFFCSENLKFAYIMGNKNPQEKEIKAVTNNTRIYIYLPEEIKNIMRPTTRNTCEFEKHFNNHDEAIKFIDVLNNPRNRFIMEFKINKKQTENALFIESSAKSFGLYRVRNNFLQPYYNFETYFKYKENDFLNDIFKKLKDENYFDYQDIFSIEDYFNTEMFYFSNIGYIRFDIENNTTYLFKENEYKAKYKLKKIENYYKMSLSEIDMFNSINIPREIYFRKLYDGFDLFVNYTYDFNSNIIRIKPSNPRKINY